MILKAIGNNPFSICQVRRRCNTAPGNTTGPQDASRTVERILPRPRRIHGAGRLCRLRGVKLSSAATVCSGPDAPSRRWTKRPTSGRDVGSAAERKSKRRSFFPPAPRQTDEVEDGTDDGLKVPSRLKEYFAFASEALPWHGELKRAREFLEGSLVSAYDGERVLARISQVVNSGRDDRGGRGRPPVGLRDLAPRRRAASWRQSQLPTTRPDCRRER